MKIVLVNPLWTKQDILPTNLAELAGYIRASGYPDIHIVDLNHELKDIEDIDRLIEYSVGIIESKKPDVIGISCNTIHVPFVAELCMQYGKSHDTPIVLGGIHPTFRTHQIFALTEVPYVVRGEGEETFLALLDALSRSSSVESIQGLSFRKEHVYDNPDRPLMKKLSVLPFPAYDLLLPYADRKSRIYLSGSRGCPFGCHFCSAHRMWHYQRRKEIQRIIQEVHYIQDHFLFDFIRFTDDCITLNREWLKELLGELEKLNLQWDCYSRVDTIDEDSMQRMKSAGCTLVYHGIESGSQRLRDILGKKLMRNVTNDEIVKLVEKEIRCGLLIYCSFMTGIPTETEEDMRDTIELASRLKNSGATVQFWIMTPYPDIDAVRMYGDRLIKIDRWQRLRQSDVYAIDQYHFYRNYYEKYQEENPDFFMFKPDIDLEEFFAMYEEGRDRLM